MPYFEHKENAFWFYWSLVVAGALVCVTYRKDPVSLSAGATATLIGVVMLLLPPLLRGGLPLWRSAAATGGIISLVALIASARQAKSAGLITGLALLALFLILVYILSSQALWEKFKAHRAVVGVGLPVSPKGYLDHEVDSDNARALLIRKMGKIAEITLRNTKRVEADTERISRIAALRPDKQLRARVKASRLSARTLDKATKELSTLIPGLERAVEDLSVADLGYWRWYTAHYTVEGTRALSIIAAIQELLATNDEFLGAQAESKRLLEARRGISQTENEALERRLIVIDRLCSAVSAERDSLLEVIALLDPFTKAPSA